METWVRLQRQVPDTSESVQPILLLGFMVVMKVADTTTSLAPGRRVTCGFQTRGHSPTLTSQTIVDDGTWHHIAFAVNQQTASLYVDGRLEASMPVTEPLAFQNFSGASAPPFMIGVDGGPVLPMRGNLAEVRLWNRALPQTEIQIRRGRRLTPAEIADATLVAYWRMNEIQSGMPPTIADLKGKYPLTGNDISLAEDIALPLINSDAVVTAEYVTYESDKNRLGQSTSARRAMMRRFLATPATNGVNLLPGKRVEDLDLVWIGNAQFAPTLLGYIEGAPPIPSENLTVQADYSGATAVTLSTSEDVAYSWQREQEAGFGANLSLFTGLDMKMEVSAGIGVEISNKALESRVGFQGDLSFQGNFLNSSQFGATSSSSFVDRLELRGTPEPEIKFPHLGQRFIPKNVGYALVVSGLADVYITRLKRSKKMIGYQVLPSEDLPPDVNTITFMINPAYTMNGSLDGLTGSSATSDRFFRHVPEMRAQYDSLYPASYFRLREAYDLKRQIEQEDTRRETYFQNFNSHQLAG